MISLASVFNAVCFYSAALGLVCWMRRQEDFLKEYGVSLPLLASGLAVARILFPAEMPITFVVDSWWLLGLPQRLVHAFPIILWMLAAVWLWGAAKALWKDARELYDSVMFSHSYRPVENETVKRVAKQMSVPCQVIVSPDVEGPYVSGFFRHTIFLPDVEMSEQEVGFILSHEVQHIRSLDVWIKLFFGVTADLMWWNPLTGGFREVIVALLEFRCDKKVTRHMSKAEQYAYLETLSNMTKRIAERRNSAPALALYESPMAGRDKMIEERFELVISRAKKPPRFKSAAAKCVLVAAFCATYLVMVQPAGMPSKERFEAGTGVYYYENYEGPKTEEGIYSSFIYKGLDGRYQLFDDYVFSRYLTEDEVLSEEYQDLWIFEEGS